MAGVVGSQGRLPESSDIIQHVSRSACFVQVLRLVLGIWERQGPEQVLGSKGGAGIGGDGKRVPRVSRHESV